MGSKVSYIDSGMKIINPMKCGRTVPCNTYHKPNIWIEKRDFIINKVKQRVLTINKLLNVLIKLIVSLIILTSGLYGAFIVSKYSDSEITGVMIGYIIAMLILINWILDYGFCESIWSVRWKHKGKKY